MKYLTITIKDDTYNNEVSWQHGYDSDTSWDKVLESVHSFDWVVIDLLNAMGYNITQEQKDEYTSR